MKRMCVKMTILQSASSNYSRSSQRMLLSLRLLRLSLTLSERNFTVQIATHAKLFLLMSKATRAPSNHPEKSLPNTLKESAHRKQKNLQF